MSDMMKEMAQYLGNLAAIHQTAQHLRVRQVWEPAVVQALVGVAQGSLALLGQAYGPGAADDFSKVHLAQGLAGLVEAGCQRASASLRQMVRQEGQATAEIVTLSGLAPDLDELGLSLAELTGEPALREAVERSFRELLRRVATELARASAAEPAGRPVAGPDLERQVRWWHGRLKTIAVTLTHAVYNRTKLAVGQALLRQAA